jgi:hypothetical protein
MLCWCSKVTWLCRKGDYYRYLAEFKTGSERKEAADQSLKAYEVCLEFMHLCQCMCVVWFPAEEDKCKRHKTLCYFICITSLSDFGLSGKTYFSILEVFFDFKEKF